MFFRRLRVGKSHITTAAFHMLLEFLITIIQKLNGISSYYQLKLHILEDFENASPYFSHFLANRICDLKVTHRF